MAGKTRLPKLALTAEQLSELQQLSQSRTASVREVQRARILCRYHSGETITAIARAWVIHLACSKPKELGYAAELWTRSLLAQHVRRAAISAGHPSLRR